MATREDVHRLVDELPQEHLDGAVDMLRCWLDEVPKQSARREFRTDGAFEAEPDYAVRAKEIMREHWRGANGQTA